MSATGIAGAILSVSLCVAAGTALAAPLTVTTEDYPPFNMPKAGSDAIVGISTDALRKTFELAKIDYTISLFPWTRAYDAARQDPNTCVYSTTRTDEREPLFKWVGPLAHNDWVLFGRADSPKLTSLADAKAYVIGGYHGDATTEFLEAQGLKVDEANADRLNPQKLAAKRIDFWAAGSALGPYVSKREGVDNVVPVLRIKDATLYLACNKAVPDEVIGKLNAALKQLTDDGTVAAIAKNYQ
jgi:polar amino acid transport system substrate-binding protein